MCRGLDERKLLWMLDGEKVEINIGYYVCRRRRLCRCVDVSVTTGEHQRQEDRNQK
jgi:hypothetical protein